MKIRVGTRRNGLAKAQADFAMMLLRDAHPNAELELYYIAAKGDQPTEEEITDNYGVRLTELQAALLDGVVDVAVHDLADYPAVSTEETELASVIMRADPREGLVTSDGRDLPRLAPGASVAVRTRLQAAQISSMRPDIKPVGSASTVDACLRLLQSGRVDGVVLPVASLVRLQLMDRICQRFSITDVSPTPGQGAIALETRADDAASYTLASMTGHEETRLAVLAERAFAASLCGAYPAGHLGAFASIAKDQLRVVASALAPDGTRLRREGIVGQLEDAEDLGKSLATRF